MCCFLFERSGDVEKCPACSSLMVRYADEQDEAEYKAQQDMSNLKIRKI